MRRAREDLRAMRERTLSLNAQGGDAVSTEYLKASLHRRAASLEDDPSLPLFFGRIDRLRRDDPEESGAAGPPTGGNGLGTETFHIGRRHVMDQAGDPVVIDWRADVSRAFYQASRRDPQDVVMRRRFGFAEGELTSYEDEHPLDPDEPDATSQILTDEIERPRVGPMRDIVATIQPEQDDVVRLTLDRSVCVQGAPGTGKTAVGLHRAAYLLHTYRTRLARQGVLVIGPNRAFLHYIAQVLPTLGEVDVRQMTMVELTAGVPVRRDDSPDAAALKGDARMADVEIPLSDARAELASAQITGGSTSTRNMYNPVRNVAAEARARLITAAGEVLQIILRLLGPLAERLPDRGSEPIGHELIELRAGLPDVVDAQLAVDFDGAV
jgi:DNA helicase IV